MKSYLPLETNRESFVGIRILFFFVCTKPKQVFIYIQWIQDSFMLPIFPFLKQMRSGCIVD
uniref:Uncharacterized protein n=1 Tax=Nelumbo nucifera TaxID=4432 RepID=A0A823A238_NELNU|nr:TPA_asm: hypothetical protein HUJ06_018125 [Nelumbo nucifera]